MGEISPALPGIGLIILVSRCPVSSAFRTKSAPIFKAGKFILPPPFEDKAIDSQLY